VEFQVTLIERKKQNKKTRKGLSCISPINKKNHMGTEREKVGNRRKW
jgi:hypothetical protein